MYLVIVIIDERIEDVILITNTGSQILSNNLPIEIGDKEAIMN